MTAAAARLLPAIPRAAASLARRPFHFLALQIPAALGEPLQRTLEVEWRDSPALVALVCLPYFFVTFLWCSAATYASVTASEPLSLRAAWGRALRAGKTLVPAALVVGLVSVLGLVALVFPAFYFTAIYLFVPHSIIDDPAAPLMTQLHRSSRLAHRSLWRILIAVFFVFVLFLWSYLAAQALEGAMAQSALSPMQRGLWVGGFQALLATALGAMVDVWICHYYLALRAGEGNERSEGTS